MISASHTNNRIQSIRAFNRFYTDLIGVLRGGMHHTPYSLTDARVLYELNQREAMPISELRRAMNIDAGYLSRILRRFHADELIVRERSAHDGRQQVIKLTDSGKAAWTMLDERAAAQIRDLLSPLNDHDQHRLVSSMQTIRDVLEALPKPDAYLLRPLRPGDLGWVVHRHGAIYSEEYGFDEHFEALVARIVSDYVANHDPQRESAWIAEVDGKPAGSIFCMKKDDQTAQLRLLLVEPWARGTGIGGRLIEECIRFARRAGYTSMMLWTNNLMQSACRAYQRAGFTLVKESEPKTSYGREQVEQYWSRPL